MSVLGVKGKPSRSRSRTPSRNRDYRRRSRSRSRDRYYRSVDLIYRFKPPHSKYSLFIRWFFHIVHSSRFQLALDYVHSFINIDVLFFLAGDEAEVVIGDDLGVESEGGEVGAGRDLGAEGEVGPALGIGREMRENQKRRRKRPPRNLRMESLRLSRPRAIMELMEWRLLRRKDQGLRVALEKGHEAVKDAARGHGKDADQDQNLERDPNGPDQGREGGGPGAGTEGEVGAGRSDGQDLEIIRARKAREIGGLLTGRRRSPGSREIMTRRKLATKTRRTRSTKRSTWRSQILLKYFILSLDLICLREERVLSLMNLLITVSPVREDVLSCWLEDQT